MLSSFLCKNKFFVNSFKDWIEFQKCALALRQMEEIFQCLPNIRCKGKWAAQIVDMLKKMRNNVNICNIFATSNQKHV